MTVITVVAYDSLPPPFRRTTHHASLAVVAGLLCPGLFVFSNVYMYNSRTVGMVVDNCTFIGSKLYGYANVISLYTTSGERTTEDGSRKGR
jgi:hypothetical protein